MNLGENIYRLRTERNMSQGDFADAMEVSRQSVSKWENNSAVPELEKLVKMENCALLIFSKTQFYVTIRPFLHIYNRRVSPPRTI